MAETNSKFNTMGVINVTPNSFSDGGSIKSAQAGIRKFEQVSEAFDIIDIGAESTAPFNEPIGAVEELRRLIDFITPILNELPDPKKTISIDTYRPEVFYEIALILKSHWPASSLIFNDVSGCVDRDLKLLLKEEFDFSYVLCHNLSGVRDEAGSHMRKVFSGSMSDFHDSLVDFFEKRLSELRGNGKKIIVDPCFGFSKTREQNHYLLTHFANFAQRVSGDEDILVGVSRKSFLRFPKTLDPKNQDVRQRLDCLQAIIAFELLKELEGRKLIFRSHEAALFKSVKDALCILTD